VQDGDVLDLDPGTSVPTGTGFLFGAALFGVAAVDAVAGVKSCLRRRRRVVTIAKTAAPGDRRR
jgi:predicted RecA/RadA family phage recombinase